MKRFFILATAAIVALASCAKTEVVYKDAPEQIAFKQITGAMTKAFGNSTTLGVFAYQDSKKHFENYTFTHDGVKGWTNPDAVWPYEGNLTFTVYAPAATATLEGDVLKLTGVTAQEDLYYGKAKVTSPKVADAVPVELRHVSAKVTVNCNLGSYTLTSLTLNDAVTSADVTVNYGSVPAAVAVVDDTETEQDLDVKTTPTQYVLPGAQTSFTIAFTQGSLSFEKTLTLPTSTWVANTAYTYNITVATPDQIYLNATADPWKTDLDSDPLTDDTITVPVE